jgi:hypothetical protein
MLSREVQSAKATVARIANTASNRRSWRQPDEAWGISYSHIAGRFFSARSLPPGLNAWIRLEEKMTGFEQHSFGDAEFSTTRRQDVLAFCC